MTSEELRGLFETTGPEPHDILALEPLIRIKQTREPRTTR
jgi:hypothetical protein